MKLIPVVYLFLALHFPVQSIAQPHEVTVDSLGNRYVHRAEGSATMSSWRPNFDTTCDEAKKRAVSKAKRWAERNCPNGESSKVIVVSITGNRSDAECMVASEKKLYIFADVPPSECF